MIHIDFYAATHGHFLEYVTNVHLMNVPGDKNIFDNLGASHAKSSAYDDARKIVCWHYSMWNVPIDDKTDPVIRITFDTKDDDMFFVMLTNLMYRVSTLTFEEHLENLIPAEVRNNPAALRNNFYSKINERDTYVDVYKKPFNEIKNPIYNFPITSFYSYTNFCKQLNDLALYLNQPFKVDASLYILWQQFIEKKSRLAISS